MMQMAKQLPRSENIKIEQLTSENAKMEENQPMRASKGTSVSASEMKKMEDEFVKHVEPGALEGGTSPRAGHHHGFNRQTKKKLGDELGFEWDDEKRRRNSTRTRRRWILSSANARLRRGRRSSSEWSREMTFLSTAVTGRGCSPLSAAESVGSARGRVLAETTRK